MLQNNQKLVQCDEKDIRFCQEVLLEQNVEEIFLFDIAKLSDLYFQSVTRRVFCMVDRS